VLGLLLLAAPFAGGTHHHDDGQVHLCAVCSVGHSPALAAAQAVAAPAPHGAQRSLHTPPPRAPRAVRIEAASSRAPPRA
jgi:hypothetical protein